MIDPIYLVFGLAVGAVISTVVMNQRRYKQQKEWRKSERIHEHRLHIEQARILSDAGYNVTAWPVNADYERHWYQDNGYEIPTEYRTK